LLDRCSNQRDTLAHSYFMAVDKIFIDDLNGHSLRCHVNQYARCFIECNELGSTDLYDSQFVALDLETLKKLIEELTTIKSEMEAILNG
jgi:hypothetical protein